MGYASGGSKGGSERGASWSGGGSGWANGGDRGWSGGGSSGYASGRGKGGGKNGGARSVVPRFAPKRGGGDWGKKLRQQEQQKMKDAKSQRESDYFWYMQEQCAKRGTAKGGGRHEERELFGTDNGSAPGIDFDKYDDIPVEMTGKGVEEVWPINLFDELWDHFELPDFLWENIAKCKYSRPTPIQRHAIPAVLTGRDAMCCAQTGSGKTCAFLVPILSCIDPAQAIGALGIEQGTAASPKALVLAPTRELCSQIFLEARKLSFQSPVRPCEVYGGVEARPQLLELAKGVDIAIATPGRLTDFIDRGVITMSAVGFLVLDEADRMLDMGFEPQIREIVERRDMPSQHDGRMTLMFSATFPSSIQKMARNFMRSYIWIGVGRVGGAVETVEQHFIVCGDRKKRDEVERVLWDNAEAATLIFVAMKRTAAWLEGHLRRIGFNAAAIHGDMEQRDREVSLQRFRGGKCTILVATDVCARGLDIPKVEHVVNYDLPQNIDDYVHRIGRTGRIGNRGWATSFYVPAGESHSNSNILRELVTVLSDAGQAIPEDLQAEVDKLGYGRGAGSSRKGGGRGGYEFGGRDSRGGHWGNDSGSAWGSKANSWGSKGQGNSSAWRGGGGSNGQRSSGARGKGY